MKIRPFAVSALVLCAVTSARPAHAHFVWGEVTSDAIPTAKLALSDGPGQVSDTGMVERIKTARVWNGRGEELTLETNNDIRTGSLKGSGLFATEQFYGVLDKTKEGRGVFKCMYYSKAALTVDEAGYNLKLPFELFARRDGVGYVVVTAKRGDALYEGAKLNLFEPGKKAWSSHVTDAKGEIRFEVKQSGLYGIKAAWIDETPGEIEGKKYPFTRNYSTLTFRANAPAGANKAVTP